MYIFLGIVLGALLIGVLFLPWFLLFYVLRFEKDLYALETYTSKVAEDVKSNRNRIEKILFGGDKNA